MTHPLLLNLLSVIDIKKYLWKYQNFLTSVFKSINSVGLLGSCFPGSRHEPFLKWFRFAVWATVILDETVGLGPGAVSGRSPPRLRKPCTNKGAAGWGIRFLLNFAFVEFGLAKFLFHSARFRWAIFLSNQVKSAIRRLSRW